MSNNKVALKTYEIDLDHTGDFRLGQRVRITEYFAARLRAAGIHSERVKAMRHGGTILQIVSHVEDLWVSMNVELDAESPGEGPGTTWLAPGQVEPA